MAWLSGYERRRKITVTNQVAEALTDFQIRIVITPDFIDYDRVLSTGNDIVFTSDNGTTILDFEKIETNIGGDTEFAVRITSLASLGSVDLFMYYGNPSATNQESVSRTWLNYFKVNHLRRKVLNTIITTRGGTMTTVGSPVEDDNGIDFGGSSDAWGATWDDINLVGTNVVYEIGAKLDFIGDGPLMSSEIEAGGFDGFGRLGIWTQTAFGGVLNFTVPRNGGFCCINIGPNTVNANTPFGDNQRHHIVGRHTFFSGVTDLFLDGVKVATATGATDAYNTGAPATRLAMSWKDGATQPTQKAAGNLQYARVRVTSTAPASDNRILMDYKSWYTDELVAFGPPESENGGVLERSQTIFFL